MYHPEIGRWNTVDRYSHAYYSYSLCNYAANNPLIYTDQNGEFKIHIHYRITLNALNRLGIKNGLRRFYILTGNTYGSDVVGANEDFHFDGRKNFKEIYSAWNRLNDKIKDTKLGNPLFDKSELVGVLLHSVQDFYAHSNYIELFVDYYVEYFGTTPSSTEIPTYDEAVGSPAYRSFREDYLEKRLQTGEFHLGDWLRGVDRKKTNEKGLIHHDQINLDKRELFRNYGGTTLHDLAVYVATVHTMNVLSSASSEPSKDKQKKNPDADKRSRKRTGSW